MCHRQSHVISPLVYVDSVPKGRTILWNKDMEVYFQDIKTVFSDKTLINYHNWNIPFALHTDASDLKLGSFISKNNKPIALFSRKIIKQQNNYTMT